VFFTCLSVYPSVCPVIGLRRHARLAGYIDLRRCPREALFNLSRTRTLLADEPWQSPQHGGSSRSIAAVRHYSGDRATSLSCSTSRKIHIIRSICSRLVARPARHVRLPMTHQ